MSAGRNTRLRCKEGDRCRIVAPAMNGCTATNVGCIVLVARPYRAGETIAGASDWIADGPDGGRHWVVASLGEGLSAHVLVKGRLVRSRTVMTMPISDHRLMPLGDDEGGVEERELRLAWAAPAEKP